MVRLRLARPRKSGSSGIERQAKVNIFCMQRQDDANRAKRLSNALLIYHPGGQSPDWATGTSAFTDDYLPTSLVLRREALTIQQNSQRSAEGSNVSPSS